MDCNGAGISTTNEESTAFFVLAVCPPRQASMSRKSIVCSVVSGVSGQKRRTHHAGSIHTTTYYYLHTEVLSTCNRNLQNYFSWGGGNHTGP